MGLNFGSLLYGPVYQALGVPASLTLPGALAPVAVRAIDKTAGIAIGGAVDVQSIVPAASVRMSDLAAGGVRLDDLDESLLGLNGLTWRVRSHMPRPSPAGQADGEVYLLLSEEPV